MKIQYSFAKVVSYASVIQEQAVLLNDPMLVQDLWREKVVARPEFDDQKEHLYAFGLNSKLKLNHIFHISTGSLNESIAHPREIFRPIVAANCYAFVLVHNHPSGDCSPSDADRRLTARIAECSKLLQIQFADHVIVGNKYFSFREAGYL